MASYKDIPKKANPLSSTQNIRYKGVWDMQDLYEAIASHLRSRKWKFHEKVYKHKHPSPFGVERQYIWQADQNIDEWVKGVIDFYIHTYDAHDIEVKDRHGDVRIFTKGKIWVVIKITDHWDDMKLWDQKHLWGELKAFYVKYIVRKRRMRGYSPRFRHEADLLYTFIQRRLRMETRDFEYAHIAGVHRRGP